MYDQWRHLERGASIESGPDVSVRCSISTSPSVYERENLYENYRSPQPSLMSFQFTFPIPIDFRAIGRFEPPSFHPFSAEVARKARRVLSCPSLLNKPKTPEPSPPSTITSSVRHHKSWFELPVATNVQFASPPVLISLPTCRVFSSAPPNTQNASSDFPYQFEVPPPFMLSKLAAQVDVLERFDPHLPLIFREGPRAVVRPVNKTVDESVEGAERSPEPARRGLGPQVKVEKREDFLRNSGFFKMYI